MITQDTPVFTPRFPVVLHILVVFVYFNDMRASGRPVTSLARWWILVLCPSCDVLCVQSASVAISFLTVPPLWAVLTGRWSPDSHCGVLVT